MERLDTRITKKIAGHAWQSLREQFDAMNKALLDVAPDATSELTTIYVKYTSTKSGSSPYAVVWLNRSSELIVGLSLPEDFESFDLGPPPPGCKYAGLTAFLIIKRGQPVPQHFAEWAHAAFEHRCALQTRSEQ